MRVQEREAKIGFFFNSHSSRLVVCFPFSGGAMCALPLFRTFFFVFLQNITAVTHTYFYFLPFRKLSAYIFVCVLKCQSIVLLFMSVLILWQKENRKRMAKGERWNEFGVSILCWPCWYFANKYIPFPLHWCDWINLMVCVRYLCALPHRVTSRQKRRKTLHFVCLPFFVARFFLFLKRMKKKCFIYLTVFTLVVLLFWFY